MRPIALVSILLATGAWSIESSRPPTREIDEGRGLTQVQIEHYSGAYLPAIRACYVEQTRGVLAASGRLELRATVLSNGNVIALTTDAPGVTGERLAKLTECIQTEVDTWHFPVRRDATMIVLPYYFQRLVIPGAGPQFSCWNPRGCHGSDKYGRTSDKPSRAAPR
jgi:hypothetical protein